MAAEVSTIQSLRAVDAWIDVINANINGGVRTAFKTSRLKFGGSNTNVDRAGTSTSLPLQFPEPSLATTNTVIDFSQGAITGSSEITHLAIQGEGFFCLADPNIMGSNGELASPLPSTRMYLTRDGEFHTNQFGMLVNSAGFYLVNVDFAGNNLRYQTVNFGPNTAFRGVYNDLELPKNPSTMAQHAIRLSDYLSSNPAPGTCADGVSGFGSPIIPLALAVQGKQSLMYTTQGSTIYDIGYTNTTGATTSTLQLQAGSTSTATILTKSLEASNASMTQSVPELSLAQKLFSALTKIIQTHQTNTDAVINLIR